MYGKRREKASKTAESYTLSYTPNQILHPILHPKSPVNTGHLRHGCRKCRLFFKNFFCGKRNNGDFILRMLGIIKASIASLSQNDNSAEDAKHRTSLGKSTDVLHRKYGCLPQRSPMFSNPHIILSGSSFGIPQKKFLKKILHFLHRVVKLPVNKGIFGCRIGCRIRFAGVG